MLPSDVDSSGSPADQHFDVQSERIAFDFGRTDQGQDFSILNATSAAFVTFPMSVSSSADMTVAQLRQLAKSRNPNVRKRALFALQRRGAIKQVEKRWTELA